MLPLRSSIGLHLVTVDANGGAKQTERISASLSICTVALFQKPPKTQPAKKRFRQSNNGSKYCVGMEKLAFWTRNSHKDKCGENDRKCMKMSFMSFGRECQQVVASACCKSTVTAALDYHFIRYCLYPSVFEQKELRLPPMSSQYMEEGSKMIHHNHILVSLIDVSWN